MSTAVTARSYPAGMVAEWFGNPHYCREACADALTMFSLDVVGVVVGYLKKSKTRVFGLEELQNAFGKIALEKAAGGPVSEPTMPLKFEELLHKNLADVFSPKACAYWPGKTRVYEVFAVYFKPQNVTARQAEELLYGRNGPNKVKRWSATDKAASYILFSDKAIGSDLPFKDKNKLLPIGFQLSSKEDAAYCIYVRFACTREWLFKRDRCNYTIVALPYAVGTHDMVTGVSMNQCDTKGPRSYDPSYYREVGISPTQKCPVALPAPKTA